SGVPERLGRPCEVCSYARCLRLREPDVVSMVSRTNACAWIRLSFRASRADAQCPVIIHLDDSPRKQLSTRFTQWQERARARSSSLFWASVAIARGFEHGKATA